MLINTVLRYEITRNFNVNYKLMLFREVSVQRIMQCQSRCIKTSLVPQFMAAIPTSQSESWHTLSRQTHVKACQGNLIGNSLLGRKNTCPLPPATKAPPSRPRPLRSKRRQQGEDQSDCAEELAAAGWERNKSCAGENTLSRPAALSFRPPVGRGLRVGVRITRFRHEIASEVFNAFFLRGLCQDLTSSWSNHGCRTRGHISGVPL